MLPVQIGRVEDFLSAFLSGLFLLVLRRVMVAIERLLPVEIVDFFACYSTHASAFDDANSFDNRIRERSLTSFEMTGIVIPSGREESFQAFSLSVRERKIMNHCEEI